MDQTSETIRMGRKPVIGNLWVPSSNSKYKRKVQQRNELVFPGHVDNRRGIYPFICDAKIIGITVDRELYIKPVIFKCNNLLQSER